MSTTIPGRIPALLLVFLAATPLTMAAPPGTPRLEDLHERVKNATVRLSVSSGNVTRYGSGTIVEQEGAQGLVVTCADLFSTTDGKRPVRVTVFQHGAERHLTGQVLAFHDKFDVALVRVDDLGKVTPIPLARLEDPVRVGDKAVVAGCDEGGSVASWDTHITAINRFLELPNLEVAAVPRHGRSGGGLITSDGCLIGVCNGINSLEKEGIYAGISAVYKLRESTKAWVRANSVAESAPRGSSRAEDLLPAKANPANPNPITAFDKTPTANSRDEDMEVICILRSKRNPGTPSKVVILKEASAQFLQALRREEQHQRHP